MGPLHERPSTAICPRTGSRVFIREELFELPGPIEVVCPACDHWHVWDPATLTLNDPSVPPGEGEASDPG